MQPEEYEAIFDRYLRALKNEGRYRVFADIARPVGEYPRAVYRRDGEEQRVTVWCSNDYLGMGHHPQVITAMK